MNLQKVCVRQGALIAMYAPGLDEDEVRDEIEELLGFEREDNSGEEGDHGWYLGPGPPIARVTSVNSAIFVGSLSAFGPEESRPLAKELVRKLGL